MDTLELLDIVDALNESLSNLEGINPSDTLGLMDAIDGVNENLVKLGGTAGESELDLTVKTGQADEIQLVQSDDAGDHLTSIIRGKPSKVKTAKGTELDTIFALVDAKYLIASHTASGAENPKYPQDLQPRDRKRESSIAWVQKTSKDLDPDMLGKTRRADSGAPIVGDDLVVESGNGRTMAILLAYKNGDADEYKAWLVENSDIFGFAPSQVEKYVEPVLVRIRLTPIDRSAFAVEANQDDKLSFTATERAKSDSKRITDGMLELFDPSDDGDLLAASNRPFIRQFLASLGSTEAAQYTDKDGNPTQALVARIKAAVFSKAYDDERLLEMMADQTKPDLQNILNALSMAAPQFVAAQAVSRSNAFDVAEKIVDSIEKSLNNQVKMAIIDATNMISAAKRNNQSITEYVTQQGLFEQVDDATASLAIFLATHSRSSKKMARYFKAIASFIKQDSESRQTLDMFGEPEPISLADVMAYANSVVDPDSPQTPESGEQDNQPQDSDIDYYNQLAIQKIAENQSQIDEIQSFNPQGHTAIEVNRTIKKIDDVLDVIHMSYPKAEMGLIPDKYKTDEYNKRNSTVKNLMAIRKKLVSFVGENKSDDYSEVALAKDMSYKALPSLKRMSDNDLLERIKVLQKAIDNITDYGMSDTSLTRYKQKENIKLLKDEAEKRGLIDASISRIQAVLQSLIDGVDPISVDLEQLLSMAKNNPNDDAIGDIVSRLMIAYKSTGLAEYQQYEE